MIRGNWNYPTSVRFGAGRVAELPNACRELGFQRPLVVTDRGMRDLPIVGEVMGILRSAGLEAGLFADVQGNPVGANVDAGVAAFKAGGHDGVVAFGGGSALDVAKAVALMVGQTRPLWDFEDREDWWTRIDPNGMVPVVAVPTTSGTGSEVGRASVIVDEDTHAKKIIFHPKMLPGKVICDPALTVGLPAKITAATGMDAFSHCLEAYCAPGFHPMADGIAVEGIRLVHRALETAVADGADIPARSYMMAASAMGATAFQKGLGGMHALSHPIGAHLNAHHGLTNAVVMPYVLVANREAIGGRIGDLARAIGLAQADFNGFLAWVLDLRAKIGIPHTAESLGLTEAHIATIAAEARLDPSHGGNPIDLSQAQYEDILRRSLSGEV
jgi:alcohol dehydrogenase class IV